MDCIENDLKLILTSNISPFDRSADYIINYQSLISEYENEGDNSLLLYLSMLVKCNVSSVALAGFEGFSGKDYYDSSYAFPGSEFYRVSSNERIAKGINHIRKNWIFVF